jgi:Ring finger domain
MSAIVENAPRRWDWSRLSQNPNIVIQEIDTSYQSTRNLDWSRLSADPAITIQYNGPPVIWSSAWDVLVQNPILMHQEIHNYEAKFEPEKHDGDEIDCSLCLDPIENESSVYRLPCGHEFHSHKCMNEKNIIDWIKDNGTCPYCRAQLI